MSSQRSSSCSIQGSQRSRSSGRNTNTKNNNGSKKQSNNNASHRKRKMLNTVQVAAQRHLQARRASSVSSTTSSSSSKKSKKSKTEAQRNVKVKCVGSKQVTKSRVTRRRGDLHAQEAPSWSTAIIEHTNVNNSNINKKNNMKKKNEKTKRTSSASKQQKSKTTKQTSSAKNSIDKNDNNTKQKKKGKGLTKEMLTCELCKLRKDEWEFCGLTGNRHVIDTVDDGNTANEPVAKEEHKEMHTELKQEVMM